MQIAQMPSGNISSASRTAPVKKIPASSHGSNDGDGVGLEQIGRHAGAIANIVAHVVGDDRWIARVILRDTGLDLAHQIGAHIGALGKDAAAQTSENRNQRPAEAQRDHGFQHFSKLIVCHGGGVLSTQKEVIAGHTEQTEAELPAFR